MTAVLYRQVERGETIVVRFGGIGVRLAIVEGRQPDGIVLGRKWSKKTGRWGASTPIYQRQLLRRAAPGEFLTTPIDDEPGW